jgi:hypothetical protein
VFVTCNKIYTNTIVGNRTRLYDKPLSHDMSVDPLHSCATSSGPQRPSELALISGQSFQNTRHRGPGYSPVILIGKLDNLGKNLVGMTRAIGCTLAGCLNPERYYHMYDLSAANMVYT